METANLVSRCTAGEERAWQIFVQQFTPILRSVVTNTLHQQYQLSNFDIEDIVQEVFVRLLSDDFWLLRKFDPTKSELRTWCSVIARSVTGDQVRRQVRWKRSVRVCEQDAGPNSSFVKDDEIQYFLSQLTLRQRRVIELLISEDGNTKQVALQLGILPQTVHNCRQRAMNRLRACRQMDFLLE